MLSKLQKLLIIALGGIALDAAAAERPIQFPAYESAITVSGTLSQSIHSTHSPGYAIGGESIYSRDTFSTGGSLKYFPEGTDSPILNVFVGAGYKRFLQAQIGYGTEDGIYRLRSEMDLPWLWVMAKNATQLDFKLPGKLDAYPNNRFVVSFTIEKYDAARYLDNVSFGLGLRY